MSDEPTAPFTFRPAPAKPSRKTTLEKVEHMPNSKESFAAQESAAVEEQNASRPRRKRRTRVEMAQTSTPGDEMAALKACLKQLRTLPIETAARVVATLEVVFK